MYIFFTKLKEKREVNVLHLLPTIMLGAEWVSFEWLWVEWVIWSKEGVV